MLPRIVPTKHGLEVIARVSFMLVLASAPGSQHQCRGGDPEKKDDDFGGDAGDSDGGGATGEGVGAVVGEAVGVSTLVFLLISYAKACPRLLSRVRQRHIDVHGMSCDRQGENRGHDSNGEGPVNVPPPGAVGAIIANQDEKQYAEE